MSRRLSEIKLIKIAFRVDASLEIGTGHVMRCLTLAEILKEKGAKIYFICTKHNGNLINKIKENGFKVYELKPSTNYKKSNKLLHSSWLSNSQENDAYDCTKILKLQKVDLLIVDHYGLDEDWQTSLRPYYDKIMVIDDLADRKHQCNLLLDQTFGREIDDYVSLVPDNCELIIGSQYALLRPEFAKWRDYSIKRRANIQLSSLLINMGGIDKNNITCAILDKLKFCNFPSNFEIKIIIGKLSPNLNEVSHAIKNLPCLSNLLVDPKNIAEIMANSDLAIGASGSTTWERCCLGLPTIQFITAKNQEVIAKFLASKGAIKVCENFDNVTNLVNSAKKWIKDVGIAAQNIVDGSGSKKVAYKVIDLML